MTMLFRKLIKNPGVTVPGRLSRSPSGTLPPSLGFSFQELEPIERVRK